MTNGKNMSEIRLYKSEIIMFFLFLFQSISVEEFPVVDILQGDWNIELLQTGTDGLFKQQKLFSATMRHSENKENVMINVFEGDFPLFEPNETDTRVPISKFLYKVKSMQKGKLIDLDNDYDLVNVEFIDTLSNRLGAYGLFNETYHYAVGIINKAQIHISLYRFSTEEYYEIILTRTQNAYSEPFYIKYQKLITVAIFFILTYCFLKLVPYFMSKIGQKDVALMEKIDKQDKKQEEEKKATTPAKKGKSKKSKKD